MSLILNVSHCAEHLGWVHGKQIKEKDNIPDNPACHAR